MDRSLSLTQHGQKGTFWAWMSHKEDLKHFLLTFIRYFLGHPVFNACDCLPDGRRIEFVILNFEAVTNWKVGMPSPCSTSEMGPLVEHCQKPRSWSDRPITH